jgi:hypothetical protein
MQLDFTRFALTPSELARFQPKRGIVDDSLACWAWTAATTSNGYGVFFCEGRQQLAHVIAWLSASGERYERGLQVCHICDFPPCTRNDGPLGSYVVEGIAYPRYGHLWLGTDAANHADMRAKHREARGDTHGLRLHPERVASGDRHGLHLHPERVARGERHFSKLHPELCPRGEQNGAAVLTNEKVREIRAMHATGGYFQRELAMLFGVSPSTIHRVINNESWIDIDPLT